MGFPTKVQLIKRKESEQWYINFPSAIAQAMDFERGEIVEWTIEDRSLLSLKRQNTPASPLKKNSNNSRQVRTAFCQDQARLSAGTRFPAGQDTGHKFPGRFGPQNCFRDALCRRSAV